VAILRSRFGYPGFRPGQEELVRAVIAGRDALGVLPTGGGKSVCYQVPALAMGGVTLVITPLVSLMEDQVGRARQIGLRAAHLSSTQPADERRGVADRARRGELDILFVAPERLDSPSFREFLGALDVRLLAVDEAHCISEWGHDFRPSYRRIGGVRPLLGCPTLALTATATPSVRTDILASLGLADALVLVRSFDRPNLSWTVLPGGRPADRAAAVHRLLRRTPGCAVVYAPTRRSVETVRDLLAARGVRAEAYHAGLEGAERTRVQEAFMADACRVVVATNAFGMGIDKPDVRLVAHVQLPSTLESYYQEAGRAGRDGDPASCVAFWARADRRLGRSFIDRTHPTGRRLKGAHASLRRIAGSGAVARVDASSGALRELIGPDLGAWSAGDPVGVLGALERIGAIRRLGRAGRGGEGDGRPAGTETGAGGSVTDRIGVRRRLDTAAATVLRRRALDKLRAVQRFARGRECRRGALLRYFGEDAPEACGRCDRCTSVIDRPNLRHA
jgi:ATP-dependent DNA helicase RecQ